MQLEKTFYRTRFPSAIISRAVDDMEALIVETESKAKADFEESQAKEEHQSIYAGPYRSETFRTSRGNEAWTFDSINEWYAAYERGATDAHLNISTSYYSLSLSLYGGGDSSVSVHAATSEKVERLMRFFNLAEDDYVLPEPPALAAPPIPVVVFIGHGRSSDWRDIKDHLRDSHHYTIEAYEVGSRAGHSIRDVLSTMMESSTFALLVMTAEDETADGDARPRQNVVHEAGLFQGRLGFNRAIAVVENGVEVFSNLDGVQQIRYDKGNVKSTFGEILATLRREFGDRR